LCCPIKYKSTNSIKNYHETISKEHGNDYFIKYPFMLDCRHDYRKISPNDIKHVPEDKADSSYNYLQAAANETHNIRILRAVLVYFPLDGVEHFQFEFRWLYRSWIYMQTYEPSRWRTDLIIFYDLNSSKEISKADFFLNQLNCSVKNRRTRPDQRPMCTMIPYKAVKDREGPLINPNNPLLKDERVYEFLFNDLNIFNTSNEDMGTFLSLLKSNLALYGYLDSILIAFEDYAYFKSAGYDLLIRSDMDVFLTPTLANWLPRYCNDFIVGGGAYSNTFNRKRLHRIANDMHLKHGAWSNLGSTWISTPEQFRIVSYLTLIGMAYLAAEEFTEPERRGQVGTTNWPEWHYGVLLLYGQNLAMNHLIGSDQLNVVRLHNYIDYPSGNDQSVFEMLHIHVYHGEDMFSKFIFKVGRYDNLSLSDFDPSNKAPRYKYHTVRQFCLRMALESKRMSSETLYKLLLNDTSNKN
jgi:hypothetical protein